MHFRHAPSPARPPSAPEAPEYIVPDVLVTRRSGRWHVELFHRSKQLCGWLRSLA